MGATGEGRVSILGFQGLGAQAIIRRQLQVRGATPRLHTFKPRCSRALYAGSKQYNNVSLYRCCKFIHTFSSFLSTPLIALCRGSLTGGAQIGPGSPLYAASPSFQAASSSFHAASALHDRRDARTPPAALADDEGALQAAAARRGGKGEGGRAAKEARASAAAGSGKDDVLVSACVGRLAAQRWLGG